MIPRVEAVGEKMASSSSPRKRKVPVEFEDLSSITEPTSTASVHGVVTSFSPRKGNSKKKCFSGYVSDGKKNMRFVGFKYDLSDKIAEVCKEGKPVHLSNCTVKKREV